MSKIKKSTTSSLPFGLGQTIHVRKSGGSKGLGWTQKRAQKNLEKSQGRKRKK